MRVNRWASAGYTVNIIDSASARMRILFYETIIRKVSGLGWTRVLELLNGLSKLGHPIVWVGGQNYSPVEEFGVELDSGLHQSLWGRTKALVVTSPLRGEAWLLWNLLKEIKLSLVASRTALRHKPDLIYRMHSILNGECLLAKLFKVPLIKEVNGLVVDEAEISLRASRFSLRIIDLIERLNLRQADKIIVVTPKLRELLCNDYKIHEDKIVVIENGANTKLFRPMDTAKARQELNLSQSDNYICFVGMLWPVQGLEYLIEAMPRILEECPNTRLLVVGDGPIREGLVKIAEQIGVSDNVLFAGIVPYQRVPLYINASDVCVAPCIKARNEKSGVSPLKLCEYMACGKPVVASKISGLDMLEPNNAGILVEPEAPEALAKAVIRLLQDPDCRKQMGENGRKYVVEHRSWESVAARTAEVCEQTLREHRKEQNKRRL